MDNIIENNNLIFEKLGLFLNINSNAINEKMVKELEKRTGMNENECVKFLLADYLDLDVLENTQDKKLFNDYIRQMVKKQDKNVFTQNPYYKNIKFDKIKVVDVEFGNGRYRPYEMFVFDDIKSESDGRLIPQIGYFDEEFVYPAVYEKGVLWMSVTPNEVNTMKEPIEKAFGRVLTFGLGLGYFAYMTSIKEEVEKVTIVELNPITIKLFEKYILPQFEFKEKIEIINADAFEFAKSEYSSGKFDYVFADIWHDAGDGLECYKKFKLLEELNPQLVYDYWIEKTIKCYLD
ncbi:MAG: hypothetical protein J6J23_01605 [Clostridia bacterium]|nr:hypothetical protein [Clostridia bacterium]